MKTKLLLLFVALQLMYAHAQLEKGKWLLGGGMRSNHYQVNNQVTVFPNAGVFRSSDLDLNVTAIKLWSKKYYFGLGIYNNSVWVLNITSGNAGQSDRYLYSETYGLLFKTGRYKEISKNLYLNNSLTFGLGKVNDDDGFNGYEIKALIKPLELGYLFNKRFLFQANLFQLNVNYRNVSSSSQPPNNKSELIQVTSSINPFINSFTIFYLLNPKK